MIDFLKPELEVGILQMTVITAGTDTLLDATCWEIWKCMCVLRKEKHSFHILLMYFSTQKRYRNLYLYVITLSLYIYKYLMLTKAAFIWCD